MSDALATSLPEGAVVETDPVFPPLEFGPIDETSVGASTTALGIVSLDGSPSTLSVAVHRSNESPGPCFADLVDERRTLDDGTVLDISDGDSRSRVLVYSPDGSRIDANAERPFTLQQVVDIATNPELRVSSSPG